MGSDARRLYAVQFHPEVAHTPCGQTILSNFLLDICGCVQDWDPAGQIALVEDQIRQVAGDRNVFFFVSGGVDSTVAYTLCLHALGPERVHGTYVDTGLMREGETEFVRRDFAALGASSFAVEDARELFLSALWPASPSPEPSATSSARNSSTCSSEFSKASTTSTAAGFSGQGTIYPDTIESGGNRQSRSHQDPPQSRRGHSEADRRGPHHRAALVVL